MGYVFSLEDGHRCDEWLQSETGRLASVIEQELLLRLWAPMSSQRVLEVGCGTGNLLDWFAKLGHQVTGLDASSHMLHLARRRLTDRVALDRGYAENLPYEDNAFDTVALIGTLEFVDDPFCALQEAIRVARRHVLLGTFNRYSVVTWQRWAERFWKTSIYSHARFFSVFELQDLVEKALAGTVPLHWRTCLSLPLCTLKYLQFLERCRFFQRQPFGHFIAMRLDLVYPIQTIQDPLFGEIPAGIGCAARFQSSRWRLWSRGKQSRNSVHSSLFVSPSTESRDSAAFPGSL